MHNVIAPLARFTRESYAVAHPEQILTPQLLIYPDAVDANIQAMLRLVDNRPERWRPHVKTAKLAWVMQRMLDYGIRQFKCATTLELATLCELGAPDVLLSFAVVGANATRVRELAAEYPSTTISVLIEHPTQLEAWRDSSVGVFIDLNSGMDRTGATPSDELALSLCQAAQAQETQVRGLHWYDGHIGGVALEQREAVAHAGYARLLELVETLRAANIAIPEVITSGTPAFPYALTYQPFTKASFVHRISPGTPVYGDLTSLNMLPTEWGFRPAALILAAVVSQPLPNRITADAGHKAVSADSGVPTCGVLGYTEFTPNKPSEEHLPIDIPAGEEIPAIGSYVYLLPRHICPSVNNFDSALLIRDGEIIQREAVTSRGHEG